LRRLVGSAVFLGFAAGAFWWLMPLYRSGRQPGDANDALLSTTGAPTAGTAAPSARADRPSGDSPRTGTPSLTTRAGGSAPRQDAQAARADAQAGLTALQRDEVVKARELLSRALARGLPEPEAAEVRRRLEEVNARLVFSPSRTKGDPLVDAYVVRRGDTLAKIAAEHRITEDLLVELNRIRDRNFIREGQTLKVIRGPFHAVVDKSRHEMYVYLGETFIRAFRVGLGENGSTPTGKWIVRNHLTNPSWTDPRTGKRWHADDPNNPIGEYWIGLDGIEGEAEGKYGYGIHGTIEPETIGKNASMGCVRLLDKDIELLYKLLLPKHSTVVIRD